MLYEEAVFFFPFGNLDIGYTDCFYQKVEFDGHKKQKYVRFFAKTRCLSDSYASKFNFKVHNGEKLVFSEVTDKDE